MIDGAPKGTMGIIKDNALRRPIDVATLVALRATGKTKEVMAKVNAGTEMTVMLPEWTSAVIYFSGDYEPEVTEAMRLILDRGMTMWNIGAHIGVRMVQADNWVGKEGTIFAIEPTPRTKTILDRNSKSRQANIKTLPFAMGNTDGEVCFKDYGWLACGLNNAAEKSRFTPRRGRKPPEATRITVPMKKVDTLVTEQGYKAPDVMVIDAEGLELPILKGAAMTLKENLPLVIFETGDLGSSQTLPTILELEKLGYVLFEIGRGKVVPHKKKEKYPEPGTLMAVHPLATRGMRI